MRSIAKLCVLATTLLLVFTGSGCKLMDQLKAREHLNNGVKAYSAKRYDEAVEEFRAAIEKDATLVDAHLYLAAAYRAQFVPMVPSPDNLRKGQQAITTFEQVLQLDPQSTNAMANIADLYRNMNEPDEAKSWYRKLMEVSEEKAQALYGIASIDYNLADSKTGQDGDNVENLTEEEIAEVNRVVEEGIGVEARDDPGMIEVRMDAQRTAVGDGGARSFGVSADGLVLDPGRVRHGFVEPRTKPRHARRRARFGENRNAGTVPRDVFLCPCGEVVPTLDELLAALPIDETLTSIRIIELKDVRLGGGRQCSETVGVKRVALVLDGPSVHRCYEQSECRAADLDGRRVLFGNPGDPPIRPAGEGDDLFLRPAARGQAGKSERRSHDLEKLTPGGRRQPVPLVVRELALHRLLELRSLRELVETSRVLHARLRL